MATYVKGNAVANATSYELFEKLGENNYNSLKTGNEINFDVSALGLPEGDHTLVVKAHASGYTSSDYSNEVVFSVAASGGTEDEGEDTGGNTGGKVYTSDVNNWASQTISSSGVVSTSGITQSNIMAKNNFTEPIKITASGTSRILVAQVTYNTDGTFKARGSWTTLEVGGSAEYSDANPYNVVIATSNSSSYSVTDMMSQVDVRSAE